MTRDEILNMAAGREMDALIATEIMDWNVDDLTATSPTGSTNSRTAARTISDGYSIATGKNVLFVIFLAQRQNNYAQNKLSHLAILDEQLERLQKSAYEISLITGHDWLEDNYRFSETPSNNACTGQLAGAGKADSESTSSANCQ